MRKKRIAKPKPPLLPDFMIEVTPKNREKLERAHGIEIPSDVMYVVPPETLQDEKFWDWYNDLQLRELMNRVQNPEQVD